MNTQQIPKPIKLEGAIKLALEAHSGQMRQGGRLPYIVHPLDVMTRAIGFGITCPITLCASVLHDVDEDTDRTLEEIRNFFGNEVADTVALLTKPTRIEGTRADRFEAMCVKLDGGDTLHHRAQTIKMIDRLSNLHSMGMAGWEDWKQKRYVREGLSMADRWNRTHPAISAALFNFCREMLDTIDTVAGAEVGDQIDDLQGRN